MPSSESSKVRPGPIAKAIALQPRSLNSLNKLRSSPRKIPKQPRKSYTREFQLRALSMLPEIMEIMMILLEHIVLQLQSSWACLGMVTFGKRGSIIKAFEQAGIALLPDGSQYHMCGLPNL